MPFFAAVRFPAAEVYALAVERAATARRLAATTLRALPLCETETIRARGAGITLAVYREDLPEGAVRIVAQAYLVRFLGIGTIAAAGFDVDSNGAIRDLSDEDLWDYL
jgi:hypothetical protein